MQVAKLYAILIEQTYLGAYTLKHNIGTDVNVITLSLISKKHVFVAFLVIAVRDDELLWRCSKTILSVAGSEDTEISQLLVIRAYVDSHFLPDSIDFVPNRSAVTSGTANPLIVVVKVRLRVVSVHLYKRFQSNRVNATVVWWNRD